MITEPLLGFARLFRAAMAGADLAPLQAHLIEQATQHPGEAATLLDLSTVLQLTLNHDAALEVQAQALHMRQQYRVALSAPDAPSASPREPLRGFRVLALLSAGDFMANTPLECLLEGSGATLDLLYVDTTLPFPEVVPEHDVLFVAVGENERNRPLLAWLAERLRCWSRPVINHPAQVLALSREGVCARLQGTEGLVVPAVARHHRTNAVEAAGGIGYPLLVRPLGSHGGHDLAKIDSPNELKGYLGAHADDELYLTPFVDYRGVDGLFRKYRVALIDGQPFLCHLAISKHWMIHYLNAGMSESAEKRAEEAQAMATFDDTFARRHAAALGAVQDRMGLDYLVLDCGETRDGRLLLFEADQCMVVHAMDSSDLFPYKAPQMRKVFDAFARMLKARASRSANGTARAGMRA
jgi:glutathione synthase/RimK-type ligase-like ATP-grasp enzyme